MSFIGVPNILPSWKSVLALHIQGSTSKDSNNCGFTQPWIQSFVDYVVMFSSVQSLSHVWLFETPWTAACQASLSITNSRNPPKLMSFESVMPSNNLILCRPLLLPSIFLSIRVFSNESALCIRWPKYWNFSFNISPSDDEHPGLISFRMDWLDLPAVQGTLKSLLQHHSSIKEYKTNSITKIFLIWNLFKKWGF